MLYSINQLTSEQKNKLASLLQHYHGYDRVDLLIEMITAEEKEITTIK
jgi:hypothetical protein